MIRPKYVHKDKIRWYQWLTLIGPKSFLQVIFGK